MTDLSEHTPVMRQYLGIKARHPEHLVFYRMGDFYELFYDDAAEIARLLHLTLTRRGMSAGRPIPMAGVPAASLEATLRRLLALGRSAVVCEQVGSAESGLIERRVVRVVTPGTLTEEDLLDARRENWVVALAGRGAESALAALESASGQFVVVPTGDLPTLRSELARLRPSEILLAEDDPRETDLADLLPPARTRLPPWRFDAGRGTRVLCEHFAVADLGAYGVEDRPAARAAAGLLLEYFTETQGTRPLHVRTLRTERSPEHLVIDPASREQLAIDGPTPPHLVQVLDTTRTAMGARLLRAWIQRPARSAETAAERHDAVEAFHAHAAALDAVRAALDGFSDLERIATRLFLRQTRPRELEALRLSLGAVVALADALAPLTNVPLLARLRADLDPLPEVRERLARALAPEIPVSLKDGGLFAPGYDPELDELREFDRDSGRALLAFEARERERTGIAALRVRHQRLLGYSLEIPRALASSVPEDYVRRQTLKDVERYTSQELEAFTARLLAARERALERERELFEALVAELAARAEVLARSARAAAATDVLATLAERARSLGWSRPRFVPTPRLVLERARHPVVEASLDEPFVPNDLHLDRDRRLVVLTGPNMGGKSTFMRQAALAVVLAYAGSYVPAARAEFGPFDRVFTRIGAGDELARGRSTFMVEMLETAHILHHATDRSLVLLDEIGRGTGTYDGLALAFAVAEHLLESVGALTLFATHYFELTDLAARHPAASNLHVEARLEGARLVLLHEVRPGAATRSYGLDVAALAGVPPAVLARARERLAALEAEASSAAGARRPSPPPSPRPSDPLRAFLRTLDPLRLTPLEAHERIVRLRRILDEEEGSGAPAAGDQ
jgi:DNA mismatch repair protein MutS